ncbi:MAG: EF-hand domain-containing protein [Rhodanobacteraceae bacterium]
MKPRSRVLAFTMASLLAATALAQEAPPPPPPPPAQPAMPPAPAQSMAPPAQPAMPPAPAMPAQPVPPAPPAAPMAPAEQAQPVAQQGSMPTADGSLTDVHTAQIGPSITVNSGMPPGEDYGPRPPFEQLDANHDGRISHEEAQSYLLLYNDWLHVAGHGSSISNSQYARWTD